MDLPVYQKNLKKQIFNLRKMIYLLFTMEKWGQACKESYYKRDKQLTWRHS